MIVYSILAIFAVKRGFLHLQQSPPLCISPSLHSFCYSNRCNFYIYPWFRKYNVISNYTHFYTSVSYMWNVINRYSDLTESSYKFWRFNLVPKWLIIRKCLYNCYFFQKFLYFIFYFKRIKYLHISNDVKKFTIWSIKNNWNFWWKTSASFGIPQDLLFSTFIF